MPAVVPTVRQKGILPIVMAETPLGNALKRLRTDARMSAEEFAEEAGVSRSTIYRLESGETDDPDLPTLRGLAKALDLSLSEFFRHIEGRPPTDFDGKSAVTMTDLVAEPQGRPVSPEQVEFLERLAWACLRGADAAERTSLQGVLEDLAVSFRRAADPGALSDARAEVREARHRRGKAS